MQTPVRRLQLASLAFTIAVADRQKMVAQRRYVRK